MKRLLSIILSLTTLTLFVCGCDSRNTAEKSNGFDYNNDFQYYYSNICGFNSSVTKSDSGYYIFLLNRFLYYIDKETSEATPLCSKVNCTHKDRNVCDAYFNTYAVPWGTQNTVQFNQNRLYILVRNEDGYGNFEGVSLLSVSPDGSRRKELASFKEGFESWLIHRGYFYYITAEYSDDVEDYSALKGFCVYRLPVDNFKGKPECLFNSGDYFDGVSSSMLQLLAYEDYLLTVALPAYDNEQSEFSYFTVNTEDKTINKIENENGSVEAPMFYDGKLLYNIVRDGAFDYYTCALDGSNPQLVNEADYADIIFSDGVHLYMQNTERDSGEEKLYTLDSDFSKSGEAVLPVREYSVNSIAQDPDCFIFIHYLEEENLSGGFEIRCIDKSRLENLNGETAEYKVAYSSAD